ACDQRSHATFTPSSLARDSCSAGALFSFALRTALLSPLTTGSIKREKDSHHALPISFRASPAFCNETDTSVSVEFDSLLASDITIPSTSLEFARSINSATSLISVSG